MRRTPIPAPWDAIAGPSVPYWRGLDILEREWKRTAPLCTEEPGSTAFQEYIFWRRISVVWACSSIEAFVNEEGVAWLGECFYKDNLEKLNIAQKIQLLYALKYRAQIHGDAEAVEQARALFALRNRFVHPKTREVRDQRTQGDELRGKLDCMCFGDLRKAFCAVTALFEPPGAGEGDGRQTNNEVQSTS